VDGQGNLDRDKTTPGTQRHGRKEKQKREEG